MLTDTERAKFVAFCFEESKSYNDLAKQLESLSGQEAGVKMFKMKAGAFLLVARHLAETESASIGGNDAPQA